MGVSFSLEDSDGPRVLLTSRVSTDKLVRTWRGWFVRVARSYNRGLESRVSVEDLVQECNIVLLNLVNVVDPLSSSFPKLLKTHAAHAIIDVVRTHRTKGRDVKKEIIVPEPEGDTGYFDTFVSVALGPVDKLAEREAVRSVLADLSGPARRLLRLIIRPTPELHEAYRQYQETHRFAHKHISSLVYAGVLGVSRTKAKELLREIKERLQPSERD